MKHFKLLFVTLLAAVLPLAAWGDTYQDPVSGVVYKYEVGNRIASVAEGTRPGGESDIFNQTAVYGNTIAAEVVIPETIVVDDNTFTVTGIENYAFAYLNTLTTITIPKTVTNIGDMAFAECSSLTDIYCYANPKTLSWSTYHFSFITNFKPNRGTTCHVISGYKSRYESKFSDLNLKFEGDLQGVVEDEGYMSTFTDYDASTGILISDDPAYSWSLSMPTDGSTISLYSKTWGGESCLYFKLGSGSSSIKELTFNSTFTVTGTLKKITVKAGSSPSCNIHHIEYRKPDGEPIMCTPPSDGTFVDWVIDLGSGIYVNDNIKFYIYSATPLIIQSITLDVEEGGVETELRGKCGENLNYTLEKLPYTTTDWNTQQEVPAMKLTITGTGAMYDYDDGDDPSSTKIVPWFNYMQFNIVEVELPNGITHIGNYAFPRTWGCHWTGLPSTVKSIGKWAFYNCLFPSEFYLPDELTTIGERAFNSLSGVKDLYIPKKLSSVGEMGLAGMINLERIHVDTDNPYFNGDGYNCLIEKTTHTLIAGSINTVIPSGVTTIGAYAFGNQKITNIELPADVAEIGESAFTYTNLTELTIPGTVKTIGNYAFSNCGQLTTVTIENGVTTIGFTPFHRSTNILDVICKANPDNLTWKKTSSETYSFKPDKTTKMHVKASDLAKWETGFGFLNVTFVGDLGGSIEPITEKTTVDVSKLETADLTDNNIGDIYYNLSETSGSGYSEGTLVIGKTTDMSLITDGEPGSTDVRDNFTGIIIKVGPGRGTVTIDAQVLGNKTQLAVRIGNGTPTYAARNDRWQVYTSYDVDEETYIYIYSVGTGSLVRSFRNKAPGDDALLIYSIIVTPDAAGVTFAKEGFGTYYDSKADLKLPAGMKALIVTADEGSGTLTYEAIADGDTGDNIVPAGTAVLLQTADGSAEQTLEITLVTPAATAITQTNLLRGSDTETTTFGGNKYYKLSYNESGSKLGWYWGADGGATFQSAAHKAWLALPTTEVRRFFGLPGEEGTGLKPITAPESSQEADVWYDLSGKKMTEKPAKKGIYINNGKKVIIN